MRIVVSEYKAAHVASITKSPMRGIPARFLSANRESTIKDVVNQRVLGDRCHVHHLWDMLPMDTGHTLASGLSEAAASQ